MFNLFGRPRQKLDVHNPLLPDGYWNLNDVPFDKRHGSWIYAENFLVTSWGRTIKFAYVLPLNCTRGFVYVFETWSYFSLTEEAEKTAGLTAARQRALELFGAATLKAIRDHEESEKQAVAAQAQAAAAKAQVEAHAKKFIAMVEADAGNVVAAIRAGGHAQLKDWLSDPFLKPPTKLLPVLGNHVETADREVALAVRKAKQAVEQAKADVARAEERARREREAAVREAERQVVAAKEEARKRLLSGPIPFAGIVTGQMVFGTEVQTGDTFAIDVRKLQHTICVGVSGSGKSVLLHLIVHQLVNQAAFEQVVLVDLKGGLEFERYSDSSKVKVVWEYDDVVRIVDELMAAAAERQTIMRRNRWQLWPHGRVALVIDEFAELQTAIDAAADRDEKANAKRLMTNLLSLSRRARALGIILVCALQKATDDQMPSALRNNLGCKLVLRTANALTARSMLEIGDEFDGLPRMPTKLENGRFYYYDASTGSLRYLQAHIVPGIDLG
jgi:hypothetical protein